MSQFKYAIWKSSDSMVHSDGLRPILIFLKYKMFFQQYYKIIEGEETILFLRCIEYTLKKRNAKQIARVFFFFLLYEYMYVHCMYSMKSGSQTVFLSEQLCIQNREGV